MHKDLLGVDFMKKILSLVLAFAMVLSCVICVNATSVDKTKIASEGCISLADAIKTYEEETISTFRKVTMVSLATTQLMYHCGRMNILRISAFGMTHQWQKTLLCLMITADIH